ncbi:unnamed protein product [Fusarium fujikuroi]|nr:unnamed protein product [Fusarium fujikuroi]
MSTTTTYPFDPATDIPSLAGKVIFITGANTGLGKATAIELAKHSPAHVYITSRNSAKGNAALEEVRKTASEGTKVSLLELDLSSFESIKSAAAEFLKREDRLDVLLLNAGVMGVPPVLTKDGYEMHMGINHLGHALLLKFLKPILGKTPDARAVHLSSAGFRHVGPAGIEFETLKSAKSETALPFRYAQSKLACLLYAREAAKRYPEFKNIAINPGEVQTELFTREAGDDLMKHLQENVAFKVTIPISEGVKNHLWATTAPDIENGEFYEPVGKTGGLEGHGLDDEMAKKLWDWTEEQLKNQVLVIAVVDCLNDCEKKLRELQLFLHKLQKSSEPIKNTRQKIKDARHSFAYPFLEGKLLSLRQSLQNLLQNLDLAVNIASLCISDLMTQMCHQLHGVNGAVQSQGLHIAQTSDHLLAQDKAIAIRFRDAEEILSQFTTAAQDFRQEIVAQTTVAASSLSQMMSRNQHLQEELSERLGRCLEEMGRERGYAKNVLGSYIGLETTAIDSSVTRTLQASKNSTNPRASIRELPGCHSCIQYSHGTASPGLTIRYQNVVPQKHSAVFDELSKLHFGFLFRDRDPSGSDIALAVENTERAILSLYRDGKASPSDRDEYGCNQAELNCETPLLIQAIIQESEDLLKLHLLKKQTGLSPVFHGFTPFQLCIQWPRGIEMLLSSQINSPLDEDALSLAVCSDRADSVKVFLEAGCPMEYGSDFVKFTMVDDPGSSSGYARAITDCDSENSHGIRSGVEEQHNMSLLEDLVKEFAQIMTSMDLKSISLEGFIYGYWRNRISKLFAVDPEFINTIHYSQVSMDLYVLPERLRCLLDKDFELKRP